MDPGILRRSAKSALLASLIVPFVCGAVSAQALFSRLGAGAPRLPFVLFFGAAMGITAFPVLARILAERKLWKTRVGIIAISCAAVNDVGGWCLLAVITVIARPDTAHWLALRFAVLGAYLFTMVGVVRPLLRCLFWPPIGPHSRRVGRDCHFASFRSMGHRGSGNSCALWNVPRRPCHAEVLRARIGVAGARGIGYARPPSARCFLSTTGYVPASA